MSSWKSSLSAAADFIFCQSEKSEKDDLMFGWFRRGSQDYSGRKTTRVTMTRGSKSPENNGKHGSSKHC